jgi:hypothetical protein
MAIELDNNDCKLGFTMSFSMKPRKRNFASRDTMALEWKTRSAERPFHPPGDCWLSSFYEAGREGFWPRLYLVHTGTNNIFVNNSNIETRNRRGRVSPATSL